MTDDLAMKALSGSPADLAVQALAAGCDLALYCSGDFALNRSTAAGMPGGDAGGRPSPAARAESGCGASVCALDPAALAAERERLLA